MTTQIPVTLISPSGSSSGQVLLSSGPNTVPNWCNLTVANVSGAAPSAGPTFTGNMAVTSSATSGTTLSLCASNNNIHGAQIFIGGNGSVTPYKYIRVLNGKLEILNSVGNTTIASLDDSGNLSVSGALIPSQAGGIVGTTTNSNVPAGCIGEYKSATTGIASAPNNTVVNVVTLNLAAGDWDVTGSVLYLPQTGDTLTAVQTGINTSSAVMPSWSAVPYQQQTNLSITANGTITGHVTPVRFSLPSAAPVYLVCLTQHSGGICYTEGFLRARRLS